MDVIQLILLFIIGIGVWALWVRFGVLLIDLRTMNRRLHEMNANLSIADLYRNGIATNPRNQGEQDEPPAQG